MYRPPSARRSTAGRTGDQNAFIQPYPLLLHWGIVRHQGSRPMTELTGWLLDVFTNPLEQDLTVWLLSETGERLRLHHDFPIVFYAAGPSYCLRALWQFIKTQASVAVDQPAAAGWPSVVNQPETVKPPAAGQASAVGQPAEVDQPETVKSSAAGLPAVALRRTTRRDLFRAEPRTVLEVCVLRAAEAAPLLARVMAQFPDLDFYDVDIALLTRYAARFDVFPLLRCRVVVDDDRKIQSIAPIEQRWDLDPDPVPLKILTLRPNVDPFHDTPTHLIVGDGRREHPLALAPARALLASLGSLIKQSDPDLILTDWGDTYILPMLMALAETMNTPLPLNRDPYHSAIRKAQSSFFSYGQVLYRGEQVHLFGRWHVDRNNAMMFSDYGMDGIFELARVTGLPVQVVARNSPGAGITAMEVIEALRSDILIPHQKTQTETFKTAQDLIDLDQGGLIYPPVAGLHEQVGEIDFSSLYPAIQTRFNLSSETITLERLRRESIAALTVEPDERKLGLLPRTLLPLLEKRLAIKSLLSGLDARDCRYAPYKARSAALKWLLVVSFGYTGYRNAIFGKIEVYAAITAYAREVLLVAKETAEAMGFSVLHLYIDGLWVKKPGCAGPLDFQPLLDEIVRQTHIPIVLDGVFRWVVFHHSRTNADVAVPNRYYGVFQNHDLKVRGLECRRGDSPRFIADAQMDMLRLLAKAPDIRAPQPVLDAIYAMLRQRITDLRAGRVPLDQLVIRQRLSRAPEDYRSPSPAARAAAQLRRAGKTVQAGQKVKLLFVRGPDGVLAWDLPPGNLLNDPPNPCPDAAQYIKLLLRAASNVLQPFDLDEPTLSEIVLGRTRSLPLPGVMVGRQASAEMLARLVARVRERKIGAARRKVTGTA